MVGGSQPMTTHWTSAVQWVPDRLTTCKHLAIRYAIHYVYLVQFDLGIQQSKLNFYLARQRQINSIY